jgi:ribose 5-phosphate isomerase B
MKIYLASDHAGFYLKEIVKAHLQTRGFLVEDFGANVFKDGDDYPEYVFSCIKAYMNRENGDIKKGWAIIFGGSGTGEAIVANRQRGVRAVVCNSNNLDIVRLGRAHNNVNVLSVGARFVDEKTCLEAIKIFMTTPFEGGRHAKRILQIDMLQ